MSLAQGIAPKRLAIVGVGLIGGSIGLAVKKRELPYYIVGVEPDADTWADALRVGAVDEITNDLAAGVQNADLVVLAANIGAIREILPRLPALIGATTVVTDAGSVKGEIAAAGFAALGERFVPGHPMAGRETGGVQNARGDLFTGAVWALTPKSGQSVGVVEEFVRSIGATPLLLPPDEHDHQVALTSHLPHVLAYVLSVMAFERRLSQPDRESAVKLSAGSWRDVTRVAASSPMLWREIFGQNREAVAATADECAEKLMWVASHLRSGEDAAPLYDLLLSGHAERLRENEEQRKQP